MAKEGEIEIAVVPVLEKGALTRLKEKMGIKVSAGGEGKAGRRGLTDIFGSLTKIIGISTIVVTLLKPLREIAELFGTLASVLFMPMVVWFTETIIPVMQAFQEWLNPGGKYGQERTEGAGIMGTIGAGLGYAVGGPPGAIAGGALGVLIGAPFAEFFTRVGEELGEISKQFSVGFVGAITIAIVKWGKSVIETISKFAGTIASVFFGVIIPGIFKALVGGVTGLVNIITIALASAWKTLYDLGTKVFNWIAGAIRSGLSVLSGLGQKVLDWIWDQIKGIDIMGWKPIGDSGGNGMGATRSYSGHSSARRDLSRLGRPA